MPNHVIDLTNQRFGKLVVLERDFSGQKSKKRCFWKCQCDCGNFSVVSSAHLRSGNIKSCGCARYHDLTGMRFGRWTVLERSNRTTSQLWLCKCDCGTIKKVQHTSLTNGASTSCGCYQKEVTSKRLTTHNMSKTRLYNIYHDIIDRCNNEKNKRYKDYGGRGIKVCVEWEQSFCNFKNWSLSNGYDENLTIDRINNDGPYSPGNCRWATKEQQVNNKRNTIYFEFLGVKKSLRQWVDFMGWNYSKYYGRYYRGYITFRNDDIMKIENKLRSDFDGKL